MKRFVCAVCLCLCLLAAGLFLLLPSTGAQNNLLVNLLSVPAPPPPNPLVENKIRNTQFYSKKNPPQDDGAIDDLMDYWQAQNQFDPKYAYAIKPSDKTLDRILAEIEKKPEELTNFLNVLSRMPGAVETVKRLYDRESNSRDLDSEWRDAVRTWLKYNSTYFVNELADEASQASDTDQYVSNQNEVMALARVDWDKARPLLDRMYNSADKPILQTLARWAFYDHALREGSTGDVDRYRRELQDTVEDKRAQPGNRDLAMDALVESGDFPGRDDWYYSLLEDETLFDLRVNGSAYTSLTTLLNHSPADKYRDKMLELIKSDNQNIRNVAARNLGTLLDEKDPEVVRALIPWLANPNWAKEVDGERNSLVQALAEVYLPESVPGLVAIMNESRKETSESDDAVDRDEVPVIRMSTNTSTNSAVATRQTTIVYPYRYSAVNALAVQKDARAAPALRALLPQVEEYQRPSVIQALLMSHGFSVPEQLDALEMVVKNNSTVSENYWNANTNSSIANTPMLETSIVPMVTKGVTNVSSNGYSYTTRTEDPNDPKAVLGRLIMNNTEPADEFVTALIDRIQSLEKKDPPLAFGLRSVMMNWKGPAINSLFLRDLKSGRGTVETVVKLLSVRKALREKQINEIYDLRSGENPVTRAFSACLLEDAADFEAVLGGGGDDAKIAVLACARLIRAPLNLQTAAQYLKNPNPTLARAARAYLEAEDSPEARRMVLAAHPNEARVLGARTFFVDGVPLESGYLSELFASVNEAYAAYPSYYFQAGGYEQLNGAQEMLQEEVKESDELLGVYAYNDNYIRIYRDKAVFSWQENPARYRERELTQQEFDSFKYYLASQRVDEQPPYLSLCSECKERELLMLGRGGGRRIFVKAERMPPFFAQLDEMFEEMRRPPARLRYWLEKGVPGLEVLFADDRLQARAVWKNGEDFRVLLDDVERRNQIDKELALQAEKELENSEVDYEEYEKITEKRREQRQYENLSWHKFERGKLGDLTTQPAQFEFIPARDSFPAPAETGQWRSRGGGLEIRTDTEGLYKLTRGVFTKLRSGSFDKPVVTADGRWAVVRKHDEEGGSQLLRVNLATGREYKINMPPSGVSEPVVFVPLLNKVLIYSGTYYEDESERDGNYFLLDAETGAQQPVKTDVRPLVQQVYRPLQPTGAPDEFWAAVPDEEDNKTDFGVYNARTLTFKTLLTIPRIRFNSMHMWVDAGRIYVVYDGHLLGLPIAKT